MFYDYFTGYVLVANILTRHIYAQHRECKEAAMGEKKAEEDIKGLF
jgi:hypothetical protein